MISRDEARLLIALLTCGLLLVNIQVIAQESTECPADIENYESIREKLIEMLHRQTHLGNQRK